VQVAPPLISSWKMKVWGAFVEYILASVPLGLWTSRTVPIASPNSYVGSVAFDVAYLGSPGALSIFVGSVRKGNVRVAVSVALSAVLLTICVFVQRFFALVPRTNATPEPPRVCEGGVVA
jgi:hypothetical protein